MTRSNKDFKGVKRTKNNTPKLLKIFIKSEYHQPKFGNQYEGAELLKFDDSAFFFFFCKTTLHHSEKFQGIPSIYLINLTIMKRCQIFPCWSGQQENFQNFS